jgi:GntR family transcriptional regulator
MRGIPYGREAKSALAEAFRFRRETGHSPVEPEHLLLGLIRTAPRLLPHGGDPKAMEARIYDLSPLPEKAPPWEGKLGRTHGITGRTRACLKLALETANRRGATAVSAEDLLYGIVAEGERMGTRLRELGFNLPAHAPARDGLDDFDAPNELVLLSDTSAKPFFQQIVDQIKEAIAEGRLIPGDRLPSVRRLADSLDLAPGTVARAYKQLEEEGVVETDGARGTAVAPPLASSENPEAERLDALVVLLRPTAVAAYHMGSSDAELRNALEMAIQGVFVDPSPRPKESP